MVSWPNKRMRRLSELSRRRLLDGWGKARPNPFTGEVTPPPPPPDPVITVSSGVGYAGSIYTVANGGTGSWQRNGANIAGQTSPTLTMTLALEGSTIRWSRSDGKVSNSIRMRRPQDIAGCVALFDIRQGISQAGSAVSAWVSQVGNAVGSQAVGARQPTYSQDAFGGSPALSFGLSTPQYLEGIAISTGPTARTYVGGVMFTTTFGASFFDGTGNNHFNLRRIASRILQIVRRGVSVLGASTTTVAEDTPIIFTAGIGGGSWLIRSNGVEIGSGNIANPGFAAGGTQTISSASGGMGGVVTSHVLYDVNLPIADIHFVEGWVAHTLGKSSLLPAAHPYKSAASMRIAA